MAFSVFIDGREGTTGLQIHERLEKRRDLQILSIDEAHRKDPKLRREFLNAADIVFLCLPDEAAIEAAEMVENPFTKVIDASTAHRLSAGWTYGFPELGPDFRQKIKTNRYIANPGCYPTGFLGICYPLVELGVLPVDYPLVCHAVSGYSGGGKKMIAAYEDPNRAIAYDAPRQYALLQTHKHQPEMQTIAKLAHTPIFNPCIGDFYSGMTVSIPLFARLLSKKVTARDVHGLLAEHYAGARFVRVMPFGGEGVLGDGFLPSNHLAGTNMLELYVFGDDTRILLCGCLDNLGKGASGAAVQNMNIALGLDEATGLA